MHHKLDEPYRAPVGHPDLTAEHSVIVQETIGNNGGKVVYIGCSPKITIGEDLPADVDLGIVEIEAKAPKRDEDTSIIPEDHLSQKQKDQKRSYWRWLFWR